MKKSQLRLGPKVTTTSTTTSDTITERKIENATEGLPSQCFTFLNNRVLPANEENALTICDYVSSLKSEINPSYYYRRETNLALHLLNIL